MPSAPPPRVSVRRPAPWSPDPDLARALASPPGADAAGGPGAATGIHPPGLERITRGLFGVPPLVVVWFELVLVLLVVGVLRHDVMTAPLVAPALVTFALAGVRLHGSSLYRLGRVYLAYVVRSGGAATVAVDDVRLGPARESSPLRLSSVPLRNARELGVCFDGEGWVAVLRLDVPEALVVVPGAGGGGGVPLRALHELLDVDDVRLSSVQLLAVSAPAATPAGLPADYLPVTSYAQLNTSSIVADRHLWLALRVDPGPAEDAIGTRGGGVVGAGRVLKRVATRAVEHLEQLGVAACVADEEELCRALGTAAADSRAVVPTGVRRTLETWQSLEVDGTSHVTWWVSRWPDGDDPAELLGELLDVAPAPLAVLSVTAHRGGTGVARLRALVRLALPDDDAGRSAAVAEFEHSVGDAGGRLRRLDGEQRPGFVATLPLGGGRL